MSIIQKTVVSLQARFIRPWMQKHFERTTAGKRLAAFKGKYQGRRCFLIGNGPSLRPEDLTTLHQAGEITFAFNRVFNIFDQTPWRPTFYISQDEKMLGGCVDVVNSLKDMETKFIPIQLKWWHGIDIDQACHFNIVHQEVDDPEQFSFGDDISRGIYNASTGMYTAVQLAAYMGFTEIYLIGVDHHFRVSQNNQGQIVVDNTVKDYFTEQYNADKENLYIPNTEKSTLTYVAMKRHCEQRGIRVFNATRGGKLEVFQRVSFDGLWD